MSIFHSIKSPEGWEDRIALSRRKESRSFSTTKKKRMCDQSARWKFRSEFVLAREIEKNLSNSRTRAASNPGRLYHSICDGGKSRNAQDIDIHPRFVCVYHLNRSSCRRGRCFQSRLYLVELEITTLLPSSLRKESSKIYPPLSALPLTFFSFLFSLPLFLARSEALLETSLRFSQA